MILPVPVDKRSLGVTFSSENQADVCLWAPLAKHIALKIQDHPETIPLKREEFGYWTLKTSRIGPGDLYTFILNGETEYPDPASLSQPQGLAGRSQAIDTSSFTWEDQSWVNPSLDSYLLYEIHTGTFTSEGTFAALEEKLDYLKALGVNAIQLMPVAQFSDAHNWGYDGVFTYAVQDSYGGSRALQHLIDRCHFKGIAVVLDVVYNHFGPEGNYLEEFGPYLTNKYCTPWGNAVNFDDAWCDGVRHYVVDNALMWFRDFHIDALRLDAVHAIKDCSPVHILQELRQQVDRLMETTGQRHYLIVECDLNDPRFINPLTENGFGMDAQWTDEFHHSLRVTVGEEKAGYYADFNGIDNLKKSYQDAYVYDGQFSAVRQKVFGRKADKNLGQQFVVFSQNHDQVGNRKRGERSSQLFSFNTLKLLAGAVLVSPYIPLLFMGEEWGETNPFFYFAKHAEPALAEAIKQGRQKEFGSSASTGNVPDPAQEKTFDQTKLQWNLLAQEPHQTLLRYYQTLLSLRQQLPALHLLNRDQVEVTADDKQQTLVLHRWHDEQRILCLMNFAKDPQSITLAVADGPWQKLLDSTDSHWQESGRAAASPAPDSVSGNSSLTLQPESFVLYALGHDKSRINLPTPISQKLYLH